MDIKIIIDEFKKEIRKIYGNRLVKVILYGSWARGTGTGDSDIDLMVVLKGKISPGKEIDRMIDCITDLNLKYDTLISVVPVSLEEYGVTNSPLLLNVRREGIPA
ncbi:MAG: nucleotidyltransferase domain-containing protein [Candidatus Aminicenantes bacterium]|nr:nucleotidyltransferase domain-containing protein [Candidatus Aminicenantes bacterium]NIM83857.1 nucleotidyltransferase domain-containing protein [Candidatus Aminicenantes bacterium]NIN23321.1 nucleotidyltransferase domain-containing protein [Candidatus Aminicenantes bacterium]NIN47025.1 nucleotidyltransferase domain-containing protein [Candidatus Aminicenantes bacterium]NIN89947.1 nucleotidyltransferase domain-containing protein [Candidatus Aminicenantes bacterium]